MLILLGIRNDDTEQDASILVSRCADLRIFDDGSGKMNLSIKDIHGAAMVVSQFTLYGDTRKGNRPSYTEAATAGVAERLYEKFTDELKLLLGTDNVAQGIFRAMMKVELVNDGPVTVMLESKRPS